MPNIVPMHPYTLTWLAQHAVPLATVSVQIPLVWLAVRSRKRTLALAVSLSVALHVLWLAPAILALARSEALPEPMAVAAAGAAPMLALAVAVLTARQGRPSIGLRELIALPLVTHGLPGILLAMAIVLSGALGRYRALAAGLMLWAAADLVHLNRFSISSALLDPESRAAALCEAALTATGFAMAGGALLSAPAHEDQQKVTASGR